MLILNKALPLLLSPIGITLLITALSLLFKRPRFTWLAFCWLWGCSMPLTGDALMRHIEQGALRLTPAAVVNADAIVVLAGMARTVSAQPGPYAREWGDGVDRLEGGLELLKAHRAPQLIITSGKVPWDVMEDTEGQWLAQQAAARDAPPDQIRLTPLVQNTAEEAYEVARMLPEGSRHILLVTSAYHMPRARSQFESQGLTVTPYPVDLRVGVRAFTILDLLPEASALERTSLAFREALGRVFYSLRGR